MSANFPASDVPLVELPLPPELRPSVEHLVTEDDTPVDGIYSEKQMRLLTEPLYSSWSGPGDNHPFLVMANVGLFYNIHLPPIVPDVLLSLNVKAPQDLMLKKNRSYFLWEYGKSPDAVIEVVSNKEGGEDTRKKEIYRQIGVTYYAIWDPESHLDIGRLAGYVLREQTYEPLKELRFGIIGLGLSVWHGSFERVEADWLRWCDVDGNLIPTGAEKAEQLQQRLNQLEAKLRGE